MTIIQNIVGGLLESEFKIVNGLYNTTNIGEDTEYICLYKNVGSMLYAVAIINCDKAYDYKDKVSGIRSFFQAYYEKIEVKNIILTEVLISQGANEEIIDYAKIKNFNLEAELIEVRWVVDRDTKKNNYFKWAAHRAFKYKHCSRKCPKK